MSSKEDILKKYRANVREQYDMPDLSDIKAVTYPDPLLQFMNMTKSVGGNAIEVEKGRDVNELIRELYPDAKEIASNLPEITIATRNPDDVGRARDLNGTDVGVVRGEFGVVPFGVFDIGAFFVVRAGWRWPSRRDAEWKIRIWRGFFPWCDT